MSLTFQASSSSARIYEQVFIFQARFSASSLLLRWIDVKRLLSNYNFGQEVAGVKFSRTGHITRECFFFFFFFLQRRNMNMNGKKKEQGFTRSSVPRRGAQKAFCDAQKSHGHAERYGKLQFGDEYTHIDRV
ncbi:hypothetical protein POVWA2_055610 [Plasmodium ovale wallikeri]|uniref:Uncharacterized protein n=1 Tax=Plasmodium ovale wallikeri TaxID=864142 RepID=A0A1A8ZUE2_PLAOA|nr:hypothetical protein POVWA1_056230 [Plasmodium ovale wallikeri]SBT48250.1 hypothetical protein POVWA2_055610 [Plasmodium ovale wallikeri]